MIIINILSIERVWEDSDYFEINVIAQSEFVCASTKSYTTESSINELTWNLITFPKNSAHRYIWENGNKGENSTPFVSFDFRCEDKLGHIIIEVYMEIDDGASYDKHNCCFFIRTEIGALNKFGQSLSLLNERGIGQKVIL